MFWYSRVSCIDRQKVATFAYTGSHDRPLTRLKAAFVAIFEDCDPGFSICENNKFKENEKRGREILTARKTDR